MDSFNSTRSHSLPVVGSPAALIARGRTGLASLMTSESALVVALVLIGLVAHGLHMFHYPSFTLLDDEGIYAGQAWAVIREHKLTPYTYFYDHAPAGWLLLAAWMKLSGGFHVFGNMVDSGRVLMLLLHLAMTPLLYNVTRKLSRNVPAAVLAALLFSISPLAIFYQRLVLLDTMMLFWVLLSLDLLLDGWGRLSRIVLSGICFGIALLTKETAVFLIPAMIFIASQQRWRHQGRFTVHGWLAPMLIVVSWYPVYALLKGELFPPVDLTFGEGPHNGLPPTSKVSLIGTLMWQSARDGGGVFNPDNQFWQLVFTDWLPRDPILLVGGVLAIGSNLLLGLRNRSLLAAGLLGVLPLLYLARGGLVLNYYILAAIPFLCLNLAMVVAPILVRIPTYVGGILAILIVGTLLGTYLQTGSLLPLFRERPDQAGREAISWIKQNLPAESVIITRDNLWPDLRESGLGGPAFPNVHSHWKVAQDPEVRDRILGNDWRTVDYLIMTPDLEVDFELSNNTIALEAFKQAHLVKRWEAAQGRSLLHRHQIIELWKVDKIGQTEEMLLANSAAYLVNHFGWEGAFIDDEGTVTSEAQSYALLRAVWSGDRAGFYQAWAWTRENLISDNSLPAWLWQEGAIADAHSAADADTDIALALLMASRRWDDPELLEAGREMVQAIWEREVVVVGDRPLLTAGDWATSGPVIALNPSYFSPYAYRIFQEVDPEHDWMGVIDSSYQVLADASIAPLGAERAAGLPPNWVGMDRDTGQLVPLQIGDKHDTTHYGYDAARTYWRIALDWRWFQDGRAKAFLDHAIFLRDEVNRVLADGDIHKNMVSAVYAHDGTVVQEEPSMVGTAGAIAALLTLDPAAAHTLYAGQVVARINGAARGLYWDNPDDLYTQEWGWLATALYADVLPNLWHAQ